MCNLPGGISSYCIIGLKTQDLHLQSGKRKLLLLSSFVSAHHKNWKKKNIVNY